MVKTKCSNCGKILERSKYRANGRCYCNAKCQMNYEYDNNIRDKKTITSKAIIKSQEMMKKHNWLNDESSREKLKLIQQTEGYKNKISKKNLGKLNGMFGRKGNDCPSFKHGTRRYERYRKNRLEWDKIRLIIIKKYNGKCNDCGSEDNLQVHHRLPYYISKDDSEDNLILLCASCHMIHEPQQLTIKSIKKVQKVETVYNFAVEDDESYVANDIIVHNCRCVIQGVMTKKSNVDE